MDINVFAQRLHKARRMSGLSMDELALKSKISKPALSKYENAERSPDSTNVIKLADALNVDMDFFFSDPSSKEICLEPVSEWKLFHRKENNASISDFTSLKEKTALFLENYFILEKVAHTKTEFKNPIEEVVVSNVRDAENAAKKVRKKWKLGNLPIRNAVDLLEKQGVKVFKVKGYELYAFEGFAAWAGTVPVIVLNANEKKEITRLRFTALHELAHLIMKISESITDNTKIEQFCDAFASEMLLPLETLLEELGRKRTMISMAELKDLKSEYGASILAIMTKAVFSGIIDVAVYNQWKNQYQQMRKLDESVFGHYSGTEQSNRFNNLLYKSLVEGRLSVKKAASISEFNVSELNSEIMFNNLIYG